MKMSLRKQLDNLLLELNSSVQTIESMVSLNLNALFILLDCDVSNPNLVDLRNAQNDIDKRDQEIRVHGDKLEQLIVRILSLQAPVGADLRRTIATIRLIYDLERVSRDAKHVFDYFFLFLGDRNETEKSADYMISIFSDLTNGVKSAQKLMKNFKLAFFTENIEKQKIDEIIHESKTYDETIDKLFDDKIEELNKMTDNNVIENRTASAALFGLRSLERLGDHICNLLEKAVYVQTSEKVIIK
jgi:phosphate transport system protein